MPSLPDPLAEPTRDVWGPQLNDAIESLLLPPGTLATRPLGPLVEGTLYPCTDDGTIYRWDDDTDTWSAWASFGGGGVVGGRYRGDWSLGEDTVVLTHDFADGLLPTGYAVTSGAAAIQNYSDINGGVVTSPPAKMLLLGDQVNGNTSIVTVTLASLGVAVDKVRYWYAPDSGAVGEFSFGVNGSVVFGPVVGELPWTQRTDDVAAGATTVDWRHMHNYPNGGPGGYVAKIEYIETVGVDYVAGDLVLHNGFLYTCVASSTAQEPGAGADWELVALDYVQPTGTITKLHGPITQAAYDALNPKDPNTLYVIVG